MCQGGMTANVAVSGGRGMCCGSKEDILTLAPAIGDIQSEFVRAQM